MKLCKLKLKNLNSFREAVELDFENPPLDDASLVAITGPTGSGKTTLLDGICVALYGKTPRLSGTGNQHPRHLISHGETEGFAEVYFEANSTRYHATWSIRRNRSPQAQLFDDSGELITTQVAQEVESILGLDFDAFKRSVMLAQGEFAAFLRADLKDRREILEKTAGIGIYNKINDKLNEKENEAREAYKLLDLRLDVIPEASCEQVAEAKGRLDRLQEEVETLVVQNKGIQQEEDRETKRKEDFAELQSSQVRQAELSDQQLEIDALQAEQENANRAQRLLPEKQEFDNAKSEIEKAEKALRVAVNEKTDAEKQAKTDQTDFEKKDVAYQTASTESDQQSRTYNEAKLDVERAGERFSEADKRVPDLEGLDNQIDMLSNQLIDKETEQAKLNAQTAAAQTFLYENRLPSDRQQCLNQVTGLLAELSSQEQQLEIVLESKAKHEKKGSSLKHDIKGLSNTHKKCLSEKADAETALEDAVDELNALLEVGTRDEWTARKQQASKAQPIAQKYEATQDDLADAENRLNALNDTVVALDAELEQIETDLASQTEVCQEAAEVVQRCETKKESAKWANPINQLRQRLQLGEPCLVCGSTEHPHADVVEPESKEQLQNAETALADAEAEAQATQDQMRALETKRVQIEQNGRNTVDQIEDCVADIEALRDETAQLLEKWQGVYPEIDVSSEWIGQQIEAADRAIAAIGEAEQAHTDASHTYQMASQQLETCENDVERETKSLRETEEQLGELSDAVENLREDVAATQARFWESMPHTFHGVTPTEAVDQFDDKIEAVESRVTELSNAQNKLNLLNTNIEADQGKLEGLKAQHEALQSQINSYRRDGEAFLDAVREKTGGLETESGINAAINGLEAALKTKETERDEAQKQLQRSQTLLIKKQTTHGICERHLQGSVKKSEAACQTYSDKLKSEGFDSLEAHNNAFLDPVRMQEITDQIKDHEDEKQQLALKITELQTRFEENPFDPEALGRIETQAGEIEAQLKVKQEDIGAQRERIKRLKDALEKREALGGEKEAAKQEWERWKNLKDIIGENKLFNFASTIILEQVNRLANGQLESLSSGRYQLKAEGIDDKLKLTIVDRWNANEERPVETLSGGESFLTSLALALALSELSSGRAQLNSLFLDEGFGTLDTETLDIAIAALEGLRMQGRSIFLISHIQELTRRLPVKINVKKRGNGSSSIDIPS